MAFISFLDWRFQPHLTVDALPRAGGYLAPVAESASDPLGYPHAGTTYYGEPTRHSAFLRPRRAIHSTEEGRPKSTA
ncbi:MAG: hypothetical protein WAL20_11490, partial [Rhodomicrobium sp.]